MTATAPMADLPPSRIERLLRDAHVEYTVVADQPAPTCPASTSPASTSPDCRLGDGRPQGTQGREAPVAA